MTKRLFSICVMVCCCMVNGSDNDNENSNSFTKPETPKLTYTKQEEGVINIFNGFMSLIREGGVNAIQHNSGKLSAIIQQLHGEFAEGEALRLLDYCAYEYPDVAHLLIFQFGGVFMEAACKGLGELKAAANDRITLIKAGIIRQKYTRIENVEAYIALFEKLNELPDRSQESPKQPIKKQKIEKAPVGQDSKDEKNKNINLSQSAINIKPEEDTNVRAPDNYSQSMRPRPLGNPDFSKSIKSQSEFKRRMKKQ